MATSRGYIGEIIRQTAVVTATCAARCCAAVHRMRRGRRYLLALLLIAALGSIAIGQVDAAGRHLRKRAAGQAKTAVKAPGNDLERFRDLWQHGAARGDRLVAPLGDGNRVVLALDPDLQTAVTDFLHKMKEAYAVVVAVEPDTGRVLALAATSEISREWVPLGPWLTYPPASLFKVVTAAAAFEAGVASPDTPLPMPARTCSDAPGRWGKPHSKSPTVSLRQAMARSANPAFGRLASDLVGSAGLKETASRLGFERYIFGTDQVARSRLPSLDTATALMRAAAGLDPNMRTSPFHMAMIMSAIANGGVMMKPRLADRVEDAAGRTVESFAPELLETVVSRETSERLTASMLDTAVTGTARKAFADPRGRELKQYGIASKTGSLIGDNPRGHYSWYAGFAPADSPEIAWAVMVVNGDRWKIKAHQVGRLILDSYFE